MTEGGILTSDDLDFLQEVYEAAVEGVANVDDGTMHEIVSTLIRHYRAGAEDREELIAVASSALRQAAG
jgi:hypothetical protein